MKNKIYDLIIVGTGPAGLSASVYASRYFINHLVIGSVLGGTMSKAHLVENYPGIESISGLDLAKKMANQVKNLGAEIKTEEVKDIRKNEEGIYEVSTNLTEGNPYKTHLVLLATGMSHRELNIPGEKEFLGKGVSYCSTCDSAFFKDKATAVIGGANAATMAAVLLAKYCKKVYLIYRKDKLRGEPAWNKRVEDNEKIEIVYNTNITEIIGSQLVEKVKLDVPYNDKDYIEIDGVFIEIGYTPTSMIAKQLGVELTESGLIKTTPDQLTNQPGVLAAGDITKQCNDFKQVVTATGQGAIAAKTAFDITVKRKHQKKVIDYD